MPLRALIHNLSIRSKLLLSYAGVFILALGLGALFQFLVVKRTVEAEVERGLANTTQSILNMVQAVTDASIRNHLRAVAEKNHDVVSYFHGRFKDGLMSEQEARAAAASVLKSQKIGTTGYVYAVNSQGVIQVHPSKALLGQDLSEYAFMREQKERMSGFLEYDWANPGESRARPKVLYMTYFQPWDWIISSSSYRDEFKELFEVEDFRDRILGLTFGKTGYSYVIDSKGNLIIHPKLEGVNIYDSTDSSGRKFIRELCEKKNGKIIYPWQNPGEDKPRKKLVIFNHIPELDWIVASSSYLEEFYEPLGTMGLLTAGVAAALLLMLVPVSWWVSGTLTAPFKRLMAQFASGAQGDYSGRMSDEFGGEAGQMANYYNGFMERLEESRQRLKLSEEKYRGIFENAVEGVFQSTPEGRFDSVNPAMAVMFGYGSPEQMIRAVDDIPGQLYVNKEQRDAMFSILRDKGMVRDFESRLRRRDGSVIWVLINARAVYEDGRDIKYIEGLITDITERKNTENALRRAKETLEERVSERTAQLSEWVRKLERKNRQSALLHSLGEMLQLCRTSRETYPFIGKHLAGFFPDDRAVFYAADDEGKLAPVAASQEDDLAGPAIGDRDCWAIRQGKPYLVSPDGSGVPCAHMDDVPEHGALCAPLMAQGEMIGLLHVEFGRCDGYEECGPEELAERKLQLAGVIADHLALALANLGLRETLRLQSIQDPLTGLYNRRYMEEALEREIVRSRRHGYHTGVLMIDVDHFKTFNDTYGHEVGDKVLTALADYVRGKLRSDDVPCRYGGEEFAIILHAITPGDIGKRAEEIRAGVAQELTVTRNGDTLGVRVSLGAAVCPEHGETVEDLLRAADEALYKAKEGGRDRVVVAK